MKGFFHIKMSLKTRFFCGLMALFTTWGGGIPGAVAADIVFPEVNLCTTGFRENYNNCSAYAKGSCPSGYNNLANTNKFLEVFNNTCQSGYTKKTLAAEMIGYMPPINPVGFPDVNLCTTGFRENYNNCSAYAKGSCPSGYNNLANTNKFLEVFNNTCQSGYTKKTLAAEMIGYIPPINPVEFPNVNLCQNGVTSNYSCSAYDPGSCPDNYYNTKLQSSVFAVQTSGSCANGYKIYNYAEKLNDQMGVFGNGSIINIEWIDWDGTSVTSNICLFGGVLNFPDIPTRPGFTFIGWSAKVNNQNEEPQEEP